MALSRKNPKHVRVTGTTLNYQRSVPKRLAHLTSKRLWSYPSKLQLNATDTSINRAVVDAETAFELFKKTLETTDPAAYAETEIERLAQDILRRQSLKKSFPVARLFRNHLPNRSSPREGYLAIVSTRLCNLGSRG